MTNDDKPPAAMPWRKVLTTVLRGAAAVLVLRVLAAILVNYRDYFPPNFDSLFLLNHTTTFFGWYQVAFYVHILASPFVLVNGLVLLSDTFRRRRLTLHRKLGWIQVLVLLLFVLPSGAAMARHAFAGWAAGIGFVLLAVLTAATAVLGVVRAKQHRVAAHRLWMTRCYVLISSAVVLRLLSGVTSLFPDADPEQAYVIASWASWLLPLVTFEVFHQWSNRRQDVTRSA